MKQPFWHRLDFFARSLFPFLVTLGLLLLAMMPLRVPALSSVMPALALLAVYHFTIRFPRLMPYWAAFLIGIIQDLLSGGVLGATAITFLAMQAVIRGQYRVFATASFTLSWALFLVTGASAFVLFWLLSSLGMLTLLDPRPAVFQYLMTIACYPALAWLLMKGHSAFRNQDA